MGPGKSFVLNSRPMLLGLSISVCAWESFKACMCMGVGVCATVLSMLHTNKYIRKSLGDADDEI